MTQSSAILEHLKTGKTISPRDAYALYGCLALHSRAAELRSQGYNIECKIVTNGKQRWGVYRLITGAV